MTNNTNEIPASEWIEAANKAHWSRQNLLLVERNDIDQQGAEGW